MSSFAFVQVATFAYVSLVLSFQVAMWHNSTGESFKISEWGCFWQIYLRYMVS